MKGVVYIIFIFLLCCKADKDRGEVSQVLPLQSPKNIIDKGGIALEVYNYEGLKKFLTKNDEKTHVINFWATWCKPCVEELPHFEQVYENYKDRDVEVVLVSLDMPQMIEGQLIPFIKKRRLRAKVIVLDDPNQNKWIPKIDENWSGALPATMIYNKEDRIFYEKSFTYTELEDQILKFLN